MVSVDGNWNLELFLLWVTETIIQKIIGILPPHPEVGIDKIIWGGSTTGSFSVKNAYGKIKEGSWKPKDLGHCSDCGVWGHTSEYVLDVLRDCSTASEIWNLLIPTDRLIRFYSSNITEWIVSNLLNHSRRGCEKPNGEWIYNKFLGSCSVFEAELWGILDGLNILIDCSLGNVMIQSYSLEMVMVIQESSTGGSNKEADSLAKLAHSGSQGLRMFGKPPFG
ncbi:hypothetical protein Gotri_027932, partial [Gossypium trilobum]|nr:hypothetical protein [Gossypium trilobum]